MANGEGFLDFCLTVLNYYLLSKETAVLLNKIKPIFGKLGRQKSYGSDFTKKSL